MTTALVISALLVQLSNGSVAIGVALIFTLVTWLCGVIVIYGVGRTLFQLQRHERARLTFSHLFFVFISNYVGQTAFIYSIWIIGLLWQPHATMFSRMPPHTNGAGLALYNAAIFTILQLQGNNLQDNVPVAELARIANALQSIWAVATFIGIFGVAVAEVCELAARPLAQRRAHAMRQHVQ